MARKPKKTSMDAAFKFLIKEMGAPKQKAIDLINARLERLEKLLHKTAESVHKARTKGTLSKEVKPKGVKASGSKRADSATNAVLEAIKKSKKGADLAYLKKKTGFDDKKLRNIVFRLYKLEKIKRVGRGKYIAE